MACLDNIIGIKSPCSPDENPLSGYFINDYPGISIQSAANVADEKTLTGYNYLVDLRRRAMLRLNNDLLVYVNSEYRVDGFVTNVFKSGEYKSPVVLLPAGNANQRRGNVLASLKTWCRFYKIVINKVRIYSGYDGDVALWVDDVLGGITYKPTVTLEAGLIKEYEINKVMSGSEVQITIPSDVPVYSNKPDCGCHGVAKSELISFNGLNNGATVATEGYGIEVDVTLKCDLSMLVCDLANDGIIGQAAFELMGAMFYDDMTKTNRVNYLTIYKGDEIKDQAAAGFSAYSSYMENAMKGLRNYILKSDGGCGCVECGGMAIKANV